MEGVATYAGDFARTHRPGGPSVSGCVMEVCRARSDACVSRIGFCDPDVISALRRAGTWIWGCRQQKYVWKEHRTIATTTTTPGHE